MEPLTSLNSLHPVNPVSPSRRPVDDRDAEASHATGKERAVEISEDRPEPLDAQDRHGTRSDQDGRQPGSFETPGQGLTERAAAERERIEQEQRDRATRAEPLHERSTPAGVSVQFEVDAEADLIQTRIIDRGTQETVRSIPSDEQLEAMKTLREHLGQHVDLLA